MSADRSSMVRVKVELRQRADKLADVINDNTESFLLLGLGGRVSGHAICVRALEIGLSQLEQELDKLSKITNSSS